MAYTPFSSKSMPAKVADEAHGYTEPDQGALTKSHFTDTGFLATAATLLQKSHNTLILLDNKAEQEVATRLLRRATEGDATENGSRRADREPMLAVTLKRELGGWSLYTRNEPQVRVASGLLDSEAFLLAEKLDPTHVDKFSAQLKAAPKPMMPRGFGFINNSSFKPSSKPGN